MTKILTITTHNFRNELGHFTRAIPAIRAKTRDHTREMGRRLIKKMREYAPVGTHYVISDDNSYTEHRPATLQKSLRFRTFKTKDGYDLRIYAASHVKFVVEKTKPHRISAKNVKFLRFVWPDAPPEIVERFGGNVVYFRSVWHPGTQANPFHERAYLSMYPSIVKDFNKLVGWIEDQIVIG